MIFAAISSRASSRATGAYVPSPVLSSGVSMRLGVQHRRVGLAAPAWRSLDVRMVFAPFELPKAAVLDVNGHAAFVSASIAERVDRLADHSSLSAQALPRPLTPVKAGSAEAAAPAAAAPSANPLRVTEFPNMLPHPRQSGSVRRPFGRGAATDGRPRWERWCRISSFWPASCFRQSWPWALPRRRSASRSTATHRARRTPSSRTWTRP